MAELSSSRSSWSALNRTQIVRVRFPEASRLDCDRDFYFGSLSAAFDLFTEEELGVSLRTLYALKLVADGSSYVTPSGVEVKKVAMFRKAQKNS